MLPDEIEAIAGQVKASRALVAGASYEYYYDGCRHLMKRVTADLWPRRKMRPSLYSLRHQFIANAKSAGASKAEIAALVGHAVEETAGEHYGRKASGRPQDYKVSPDPSEVNRIRKEMFGNPHQTTPGDQGGGQRPQ